MSVAAAKAPKKILFICSPFGNGPEIRIQSIIGRSRNGCKDCIILIISSADKFAGPRPFVHHQFGCARRFQNLLAEYTSSLRLLRCRGCFVITLRSFTGPERSCRSRVMVIAVAFPERSGRRRGAWGSVMADAPIRYARVSAADGGNVLAWILASAAMLLELVAPALWNGFPLIFPDTGGYLDGPTLGTLVMGRSALYGLFLYTGVPFSFWPNVVLQSALTVWLIVLTMRAHGLGGRPWLTLGIVAMLTVCTSLPFFSAQLMPDILFPAAVLALYLLIFRGERLTLWEHFLLAAAVAVAIASHMAAAGICVAIIAAVCLSMRFKPLALAKPRMWFAAGSVAAGIALCPISNLAITGNFAFTPGGSSFLFGRLIKDGIVARYLGEHCPDASMRLCSFKSAVPEDAGSWLWDADSPFQELGG